MRLAWRRWRSLGIACCGLPERIREVLRVKVRRKRLTILVEVRLCVKQGRVDALLNNFNNFGVNNWV